MLCGNSILLAKPARVVSVFFCSCCFRCKTSNHPEIQHYYGSACKSVFDNILYVLLISLLVNDLFSSSSDAPLSFSVYGVFHVLSIGKNLKTRRLTSCGSNHLHETVSRDFTSFAHFRKNKLQILLGQTLFCTDVGEDAFDTVETHEVVMDDCGLGNVLFKASGEFLGVAERQVEQ